VAVTASAAAASFPPWLADLWSALQGVLFWEMVLAVWLGGTLAAGSLYLVFRARRWAIVLLLLSPRPGALRAQAPRGISYAELGTLDGLSFCQAGESRSFIRRGLDSLRERATQAHEAMHERQMQRFPSCDAFDRWYRSGQGRVWAEAEAYMAGLCAIRSAVDTAELRADYEGRVRALLANQGPGSQEVVADAFRRFGRCPAALPSDSAPAAPSPSPGD
jgi:hypothetical protein